MTYLVLCTVDNIQIPLWLSSKRCFRYLRIICLETFPCVPFMDLSHHLAIVMNKSYLWMYKNKKNTKKNNKVMHDEIYHRITMCGIIKFIGLVLNLALRERRQFLVDCCSCMCWNLFANRACMCGYIPWQMSIAITYPYPNMIYTISAKYMGDVCRCVHMTLLCNSLFKLVSTPRKTT